MKMKLIRAIGNLNEGIKKHEQMAHKTKSESRREQLHRLIRWEEGYRAGLERALEILES